MKNENKASDYDLAEASAHHFCEGMDDDRYISIHFNFAEKAVKKVTREAMPSSTPLGRITINDRGETVATAAGALFEQVERIGKNPFQQDERMSEVVFIWQYFVNQYAVPFLQKKQQACERKGKKDAARQFADIIEQLSNMVTTISKTKTILYKSPKDSNSIKRRESCTYYIPTIPTDQFRVKGEELLAKEEEATKQLFTDISPDGYTQADRERDEQTAIDAKKAAARTKKEFDACAKGGEKSAESKKEDAEVDSVKESIIRKCKEMMKEWDERYPERSKPGCKSHSNNLIYTKVAELHLDHNGKPIFDWEQIKEWFKPSKIKRRGGRLTA